MERKLTKEEFLKKVENHVREKERIERFLTWRRNTRARVIEAKRRKKNANRG